VVQGGGGAALAGRGALAAAARLAARRRAAPHHAAPHHAALHHAAPHHAAPRRAAPRAGGGRPPRAGLEGGGRSRLSSFLGPHHACCGAMSGAVARAGC
jgi:hypothetical protein